MSWVSPAASPTPTPSMPPTCSRSVAGQGRLDELVDLLVAMVEAAPDIEAFRPALGVSLLRSQPPRRARAVRAGRGRRVRPLPPQRLVAGVDGHERRDRRLLRPRRGRRRCSTTRCWPWRDQVVWTGTTAGRSVAVGRGAGGRHAGPVRPTPRTWWPRASTCTGACEAPVWTAESLVATAWLCLTRRATRVMLDRARTGAGRGDGAGRLGGRGHAHPPGRGAGRSTLSRGSAVRARRCGQGVEGSASGLEQVGPTLGHHHRTLEAQQERRRARHLERGAGLGQSQDADRDRRRGPARRRRPASAGAGTRTGARCRPRSTRRPGRGRRRRRARRGPGGVRRAALGAAAGGGWSWPRPRRPRRGGWPGGCGRRPGSAGRPGRRRSRSR